MLLIELLKAFLSLSSDAESSSDIETECKEAILALEVARARRKVRQAQQHLTSCVLEEYTASIKLYRCRAEMAEKRLEDADMNVGRVRNNIRRRNLPVGESVF